MQGLREGHLLQGRQVIKSPRNLLYVLKYSKYLFKITLNLLYLSSQVQVQPPFPGGDGGDEDCILYRLQTGSPHHLITSSPHHLITSSPPPHLTSPRARASSVSVFTCTRRRCWRRSTSGQVGGEIIIGHNILETGALIH